MRIRDWSSDVCSSDLEPAMGGIDDRTRHPAGQQRRSLIDDPRLDLAGIMAPRLERAAQRADRPRIDRAMRHVGRLEFGLADRTAHLGLPPDRTETRRVGTEGVRTC